ncbi:hypothetical protein ACIQU5_19530 [Streptomyces sp. NPDC090306]|uniref:hypothetical protein n=1 Tax=Streptomyces sp. NPDC090306 TaxID=3365961 RepID=UPI00380DD78F
MVMQPVLEISAVDDFALWPVGQHKPYGYPVLNGDLTRAEVGTAVMQIADCNGFGPIELPVEQVRTLVAGAQQDVRDFLGLAEIWAEQHLPAQAAGVAAALARALDLAPAS